MNFKEPLLLFIDGEYIDCLFTGETLGWKSGEWNCFKIVRIDTGEDVINQVPKLDDILRELLEREMVNG